MELSKYWIYLLIMAGVTYLIRMIPLVLCKGQFKNRFMKSVLHYIPYAVLAAMTFPTAFYASQSLACSALGVAVALVVAYKGGSLLKVAIAACMTVLVSNLCVMGIQTYIL